MPRILHQIPVSMKYIYTRVMSMSSVEAPHAKELAGITDSDALMTRYLMKRIVN